LRKFKELIRNPSKASLLAIQQKGLFLVEDYELTDHVKPKPTAPPSGAPEAGCVTAVKSKRVKKEAYGLS